MTIKDFNIGDKVFVRDYNFRTNESTAVMKEATVTKVGKKFVSITYGYGKDTQFGIISQENEFYLEENTQGTRNKLFKSMNDVDNWIERMTIERYLKDLFDSSYKINNISLEKLRQIKSICMEG